MYTFNKVETELSELYPILRLLITISNDEKSEFIIRESMFWLSDISSLDIEQKRGLLNMLNMYYKLCYDSSIATKSKSLPYGKIEVYKVSSTNGLRYATQSEVEQGVRGIIPEFIYPIEQRNYELLALYYWTVTGVSYYYRQSGLNISYDSNGKVKETFYELVSQNPVMLFDMMKLVENEEKTTKMMKILNKYKKSKGYVYSSFEKDEIHEDISSKQIIYNIDTMFPRGSDNPKYRKALSLVIKIKGGYKPTPYDISTLREIYDEFSKNNAVNIKYTETDVNLKKECEAILIARNNGLIHPSKYVFKIIESLSKFQYTRCSDKQYSIIKEALNIIGYNNENANNNNDSVVISDDEINTSLDVFSEALSDDIFN